MSQTPERAAEQKIVNIIAKPRPMITFGLPNVPRKCGGARRCDEVSAMLTMLQQGEPGMTIELKTFEIAHAKAAVMRVYSSRNRLPVRIQQRGVRIYVTPTKPKDKR